MDAPLAWGTLGMERRSNISNGKGIENIECKKIEGEGKSQRLLYILMKTGNIFNALHH